MPYRVRGALKKEVDGSVNILVAVVERYHALVLVLSGHLHQLWTYTHGHTQIDTSASFESTTKHDRIYKDPMYTDVDNMYCLCVCITEGNICHF